jgi:hypothetical protein
MGLGANLPIAAAPGMGLNAYFLTVVGERGSGRVRRVPAPGSRAARARPGGGSTCASAAADGMRGAPRGGCAAGERPLRVPAVRACAGPCWGRRRSAPERRARRAERAPGVLPGGWRPRTRLAQGDTSRTVAAEQGWPGSVLRAPDGSGLGRALTPRAPRAGELPDRAGRGVCRCVPCQKGPRALCPVWPPCAPWLACMPRRPPSACYAAPAALRRLHRAHRQRVEHTGPALRRPAAQVRLRVVVAKRGRARAAQRALSS